MREVMRAARPGRQLVRVAALLGHNAVMTVQSHLSVWVWWIGQSRRGGAMRCDTWKVLIDDRVVGVRVA